MLAIKDYFTHNYPNAACHHFIIFVLVFICYFVSSIEVRLTDVNYHCQFSNKIPPLIRKSFR